MGNDFNLPSQLKEKKFADQNQRVKDDQNKELTQLREENKGLKDAVQRLEKENKELKSKSGAAPAQEVKDKPVAGV